MTPTEARALAEQLFNCGVPEPGLALYSLADQVEALQVAEDALLRKGYQKSCDMLERYGIAWIGGSGPIHGPMNDGYWTPWHIAQEELDRLREDARMLRLALGTTDAAATLYANQVAHWIEKHDALKADALRYRWLRDESWKGASLSAKYCFVSNNGEGLDDAIDRAREAT